MSTATTHLAAPPPLEMPVPVARVPTLDELRRLTEVPERRVVFRGVDWAFYETLVDSIPDAGLIHVDYDGRDLEIMAKGRIEGDIDAKSVRVETGGVFRGVSRMGEDSGRNGVEAGALSGRHLSPVA